MGAVVIDAHDWPVSHHRSGEVAQRVVVGALTLTAADAESARWLGVPVAICPRGDLAAEVAVALNVEAKVRVIGVEAERDEPEAGEVLVLVDLDKAASQLVQEVAFQGVGPSRALHVTVAAKRIEDPLERIDGGLGLARQTVVASLVSATSVGASA